MLTADISSQEGRIQDSEFRDEQSGQNARKLYHAPTLTQLGALNIDTTGAGFRINYNDAPYYQGS